MRNHFFILSWHLCASNILTFLHVVLPRCSNITNKWKSFIESIQYRLNCEIENLHCKQNTCQVPCHFHLQATYKCCVAIAQYHIPYMVLHIPFRATLMKTSSITFDPSGDHVITSITCEEEPTSDNNNDVSFDTQHSTNSGHTDPECWDWMLWTKQTCPATFEECSLPH